MTTKNILALFLLIALSSCSVGKKLTKTGFCRTTTFTMQGYTWYFDKKYAYRESMNGYLVIYRTDDAKIQGVLEAYKMINQHSVATK